MVRKWSHPLEGDIAATGRSPQVLRLATGVYLRMEWRRMTESIHPAIPDRRTRRGRSMVRAGNFVLDGERGLPKQRELQLGRRLAHAPPRRASALPTPLIPAQQRPGASHYPRREARQVGHVYTI